MSEAWILEVRVLASKSDAQELQRVAADAMEEAIMKMPGAFVDIQHLRPAAVGAA